MVEGAARIFDFAGALNQYNSTSCGRRADLRALQADWRAVGGDIQKAVRIEIPEGVRVKIAKGVRVGVQKVILVGGQKVVRVEQKTLNRRSDSQETS